MDNPFLSPDEKKKGLKYYYRHQILNGIGFNFLGDTPVYLLAIHFGASNVELGYISSVLYMAGLVLLVVPRLFNGMNMVKIQYTAWFIRGGLCLSYLALFFLTGRPAVLLILIMYTIFCIVRSVGVAFHQPILRMLSSNRNRGTVLAASSFQFQWATTVSRIISFLVTSIKQLAGVTGILLLQVVGVSFNTLAAWQLTKVPCRERVQYTKGRNVFVILKEALAHREYRYCIILGWINTCQLVLFGFMIPLLQRDAGFSSSQVFLFTLGTGLAYILAAVFSRLFADRIGSKPLLFGSNALLAVASLLWGLASPGASLVRYILYGAAAAFFLRSSELLVNRLIVRGLPDENAISYSSMINFFVGLVALAAGLAGGKLADLSAAAPVFLKANSFSYTYFLSFFLCIAAIILTARITDKGSLSAQEAAEILFSPTNLSTYQQINRLDRIENSMKRRTMLLNISRNNSKMATREIRNVFFDPLSSDKGELINSLFSNPRPDLLPELLREASEPYSYHRIKAIFALGAYPGEETEAFLLSLLKEPYPTVVSNAAKSLGRIGSTAALEEIRVLADKTEGIWNYLNFIIALGNMDRSGEYLSRVFLEEKVSMGSAFNQTVYSLYAKLLEMEPPLSHLFQQKNMKKGQGLRDFLDEARDSREFYHSHYDFLVWFREEEFESVWNRCKEILAEKPVPEYFRFLKESLLNFPSDRGAYDDALAAVYYCYQLLKLEGLEEQRQTNPRKEY